MAEAVSQDLLEFASFRVGRAEIEGGTIPRELYEGIGSNDTYAAKSARASPARVKSFLYIAGSPAFSIEVPESTLTTGRILHQDQIDRSQGRKPYQGHIHNDVLVYLPKSQTPRGHTQMGDRWHLARYHINVKDLQPDGTFTETEEPIFPSWVPVDGVAVPNAHGYLDPDTGLFLETVESKADRLQDEEEAIQRFRQANIERNLAMPELSRVYSGGNHNTVYVVRSVADDYDGPLCFSIRDGPGGRGPDIGSLPLSRSPSGARPLSESQYRRLEDRLATTEENLREAQERMQAAERALKGK